MEQSDTMEVQINHHEIINLCHQIGIMYHQGQQHHHTAEEPLQEEAIREHHHEEDLLIVLQSQNHQPRLQQDKATHQVVLLRQDKVSHLVILVEEAE